MKMVHGNAVFIREEAKLAETLTGIHFQCKTSLFSTPLTSLSKKQTTPLAARMICSCDYDVTLGGITHKSWYLHGAESFVFSKTNSPKLKKVAK